MVQAQNFDEQKFDKLIVGFIGKVLQGKGWKELENLDESLAIRQIHQSFPLSNFCTIWYH